MYLVDRKCRFTRENVKVKVHQKECTSPLESEDSLAKGVYLVVRK